MHFYANSAYLTAKVLPEMVRLIEAQRAYETNSKMVQTAEDMMSVTNGIKR